jgi:hypothetical protein
VRLNPSSQNILVEAGRQNTNLSTFNSQNRWRKLGATDAVLADAFQVRISTIRLWMNNYPEFSEAIRVGKDAANQRVERSLYERANGYNYEAVKIFMPAGSKQPIVVHYTEHCIHLVEEQRSRALARCAERRACAGQVHHLGSSDDSRAMGS